MAPIKAVTLALVFGAVLAPLAMAQSAEEEVASANSEVVATFHAGDYGRALALAKAVLEQAELKLGPGHPSTLISVNNLAGLYNTNGLYSDAERLYLRVLDGQERQLGLDHPSTLTSVNNLALLYQRTGRYGEAEPLYLRAIRISERVLGKEHRLTIVSMNNLAFLYENTGRFGEAAPLYARALESRERALGPDHLDTLTSINNLAGLYQRVGRLGEAKQLFIRASEISERVLGLDHPDTLGSLNNLATVYQETGPHHEAEKLFQRVLENSERILGLDHPETLVSLINLAFHYESVGRYDEAQPLYTRALESSEQVLGPKHPSTINHQGNLAVLFAKSARPEEALQLLEQLDLNLDEWLRTEVNTAQAASMRRQMLLLGKSYQDISLSLVLDHPNRASISFAADLLLRWKKRISQEDALLNNIIRDRDNGNLVALVDAVKEGRRALSNVAFDPNVVADEKERLRRELETKETALRAASEEFRRFQTVSQARASDIERILKPGQALIEYKFFNPFDFENTEYGAWRLLAVILRSGEEPDIVDLGDAEFFSAMQALTVNAKFRGEEQVSFDTMMSNAFERLIAPFEPLLQDVDTLYIAPDGVLGALPFEAFITNTDQRLIERYRIRNIQTGRDLIGKDLTITGKGLVAIGGVDFGATGNAVGSERATNEGDLSRRALEITRDQFASFGPLPQSGPEVTYIKDAYAVFRPDEPKPIILPGRLATEQALKSIDLPPRVLHLATHGYFLKNGSIEGRPLLQSGIALANANRALYGGTDSGQENGILHAVEVQNLNLVGTQLVVLSACETGQGVEDYSEGLEGLPRAFFVAGAQNVLAALWPVGDLAARNFMARFYDYWLDRPDGNIYEALRETKLWYIRNERTQISNPKNWANFVLIEG